MGELNIISLMQTYQSKYMFKGQSQKKLQS